MASSSALELALLSVPPSIVLESPAEPQLAELALELDPSPAELALELELAMSSVRDTDTRWTATPTLVEPLDRGQGRPRKWKRSAPSKRKRSRSVTPTNPLITSREYVSPRKHLSLEEQAEIRAIEAEARAKIFVVPLARKGPAIDID